MNWTEQTESMMNAWADAQKQIWGGFYDLARGGNPAAGFTNIPLNLYDPSSWLRQVAEAWSKGGGGDVSERAAGSLFASQTAMMQIMNLLTKSWQIVAPNIEAGKPWKPDFEKMRAEWIEQIKTYPGRAQGMAQNLTDLAKSIGNWGPMLAPWVDFINHAAGAGHLGQVLGDSTGFGKLLQIEQLTMEPPIGRLAELPRAGLTRETSAKLLRLSDALVDLRKASLVYDLEVAKGIGEALEKTMDQLAELAKQEKKIRSIREVTRLWFQTADRTLTQKFCSDEFVALQNDLSSAGMAYRLRLRAVLEMLYHAIDIPTRSEIDQAYRAIHDLKKEVRSLQRQIRELKASKD